MGSLLRPGCWPAAVCVVYCWQLLFAQYLHNALIYDYPRRELEFLNFYIVTMIINRHVKSKLFPPKIRTFVHTTVSECFVDKNPNFNMDEDYLLKLPISKDLSSVKEYTNGKIEEPYPRRRESWAR